MANITIYTRAMCPYCTRAKALLKSKGVTFTEINAGMNAAKRQEMRQRSGRNTFPQIFINDEHIGGCDELVALDTKGGLDAKLA